MSGLLPPAGRESHYSLTVCSQILFKEEVKYSESLTRQTLPVLLIYVDKHEPRAGGDFCESKNQITQASETAPFDT